MDKHVAIPVGYIFDRRKEQYAKRPWIQVRGNQTASGLDIARWDRKHVGRQRTEFLRGRIATAMLLEPCHNVVVCALGERAAHIQIDAGFGKECRGKVRLEKMWL